MLTYTPSPAGPSMSSSSQLVHQSPRSTSGLAGASDPYYRGSPHGHHGYPPTHSLLMSPHTPEQHGYQDARLQESPMGVSYIGQSPHSTGPTPRARRTSTPKAVKIFQCSGYGQCNMTFTRSEHLARHVR